MCLSVPAKVLSIKDKTAIVSIGGTEYDASLQMIEGVEVGDYVLLHTGFVIQKLSEEEANETIKLLQEVFEKGDEEEREKQLRKIT